MFEPLGLLAKGQRGITLDLVGILRAVFLVTAKQTVFFSPSSLLAGLEKILSGRLGEVDFTCPLGKAPDKPHFNSIPKGKLGFQFFFFFSPK